MYRTAYYISLATNNLELTGEMALAMLMKEYGISGNAELEMMKIISRVSCLSPVTDYSTKSTHSHSTRLICLL